VTARGAQPGRAWYTPGRVRWLERKRREREARHDGGPLCVRCYKRGHTWGCCTTSLVLWTTGPDVMIAESAERAARICNDPLGPDSDEDLYSAPEHWRRVEGPFTVNGVTLAAEEWADLYGEGWLVIDGALVDRQLVVDRR
jgi:hypothetical protein